MTLTAYPTVYKLKRLESDGAVCDLQAVEIKIASGKYGGWSQGTDVKVAFQRINHLLSDGDKRMLQWAERMQRKGQWAKVKSAYNVANMTELEFYVYRRVLNRNNRRLVEAATIVEPGVAKRKK